MESLRHRLDTLRRRLLAANLRSRSIRLIKPTRSGMFDLHRLETLAPAALRRVIRGMGRSEPVTVDVLEARGGDEDRARASEDLRTLANEAHRTWMEVGENELLLGWPVLEARLAGTWVRAPLLLFPASLRRSREGKLVWQLALEGRPDVNEVLTQTLFRLAGARLDLDRLHDLDEDARIQPDGPTWGAILQWLADGGLPGAVSHPPADAGAGEGVGEGADLALPPLAPLAPRLRADQDALPEGEVRLWHHLILGRFPQSSSNVLGEYAALDSRPALLAEGPAADLLAVDLDARARAGADDAGVDTDGGAAGPGAAGAAAPQPVRVLPSDASQEAVIRALDQGAHRGLVVRGPPGTGKSQLIGNLVGQAIDRGQSVLVVCQKRAALDVVAARLGSLGLDEPLAVVHDVHRDRAEFCARLARTLETVLGEAGDGAAGDVAEGAGSRDEARVLARHERALHRFGVRLEAGQEAYRAMRAPGPGGVSLAELLERALDDDGRPLPDLAAVAGDVTEAGAVACLPAIETAARHARPFAAPHPMAARTDWSGLDEAGLAALRAHLEALRDRLAACVAGDGAAMSPGEARDRAALWDACAPVVDLFESADIDAQNRFALFWHFTDAGRSESGFAGLIDRLAAAREELADLPPRLYDTDGRTVAAWLADLEALESLGRRWWRVLTPRFWRLRRLPAAIVHACDMGGHGDHALVPARGPHELAAHLAGLCRMTLRWHALVREVTETLFTYPFYAFGCRGQRADLDQALADLRAIHDRVRQIHRLRDALGDSHAAYRELPGFEPDHQGSYADLPLVRAAVADRAAARHLESAEIAAGRLEAHMRRPWLDALLAGAGAGRPDGAPIDALLACWDEAPEVAALDRELASLPVWAREFLRGYRPRTGPGFDPDSLEIDLVRALERAWRTLALAGRSAARAEAALVDEEQRAALESAHDELVACAGPAVAARYVHALRAAAADRDRGRALRKLLGEARKRRNRRSIRQLVEAYWDQGLRRLRPVWLCSPESVAALFPLQPGIFDLIVLDEASQCPVESALPALVRGKRVLVAGDEKQMPPSHFFLGRDHEAEDTEEDEAAASALLAAESILDVARVAYPGMMLRYHYRSRHEELITFSNHAFYEGRLVTAPPAEVVRADHEGLRFERVDGQWQDQVNRVEAEAVVARVLDLLGRRLPGGGRPSVGVVTFNQKQRALIEELLDRRATTDELARARLADEWERDATEALFVKNLENVQGDERDVIVFSTGYGPPEPGARVAARFGPVSQEGGENRLNVAITRARHGVFVIASFVPAQLDVSGVQRIGPRLLRLYLDYVHDASEHEGAGGARILAEVASLTGQDAGGAAGPRRSAPVGRRVRDELAAALEQRGLVVARDFGIGPYRLDLAVRGRAGAARWACGVDCTRFLDTADTVQRDVTEPAFWRRAGWRILRVSPAAWLERRDAVVRGIEGLVSA